jgi:hypothetical protein
MKENAKKETLTIVVASTPPRSPVTKTRHLEAWLRRRWRKQERRPATRELELKDKVGTVLDLNRKIKDYNFPEDVVLFLSLKAGIGG